MPYVRGPTERVKKGRDSRYRYVGEGSRGGSIDEEWVAEHEDKLKIEEVEEEAPPRGVVWGKEEEKREGGI